MRLRLKILSGFLILVVMLLIAGIWSIYELNSIGSSVQKILDENYRSIHASKMMIEALEREDSGTLLLLLGRWDEGRKILREADSLFDNNFDIAYSNITLPDEKQLLDSINIQYSAYKNLWEKPIVGTNKEGNLNWYFREVHQSFNSAKTTVNKLINLNDKTLYGTATDLEKRANRSIMPGIIAIISALAFTLIFNYFVDYYVVSPIINITKGVKNFISSHTPFLVEIDTKDEIKDLADSIDILCKISETGEKEQ